MRNPQGYATWTGPTGVNKEQDTFTCCHCNTVIFVAPLVGAAEMGGFCRLCMSLICGTCAGKGSCTPWEKQMEKAESRDRMLRSIGIKG